MERSDCVILDATVDRISDAFNELSIYFFYSFIDAGLPECDNISGQ